MQHSRAGQTLTLEVTGHGAGGEGVCLYENIPVFVDGAIAGEQIIARVMQDKKRFMKAQLCQVLRPSPLRTAPSCPHFDQCGGCALMHQSRPLQSQVKTDMVINALWHIGRIAPENYRLLPIQTPQDGETARNKVYFHVDSASGRVGFYAPASKTIVDVPHCVKLTAQARAARQTLRAFFSDFPQTNITGMMVRTTKNGAAHITLVNDGSPIEAAELLVERLCRALPLCGIVHAQSGADDNVGQTRDILFGTLTCTDTIGSLRFTLSPQSFFQVHPAMTLRLYQTVSTLLAPEGKTVLDAYCGAGTISLFLAAQGARRVLGVESVAPAIEDAKDNARNNGLLDKVDFYCCKAETLLPQLAQTHHFDAAVIDPPRRGCAAPVIDALCRIAPERIVYVSCNPATLARDLKLFIHAGYHPQTVAPLDLFPDTTHVEAACLLLPSDKQANPPADQ